MTVVLQSIFLVQSKSIFNSLNYEHPKIIVTTRRENFLQKFNPIRIKLSSLAKPEAIKLCETSLNSFLNASKKIQTEMREDIERLCWCLENYPLAMQQAIAYLNEMMGASNIDNFIEEFRKTVRIFENRYAKQKVDDGYPHTVATVFDLSLEAIGRTEKALELIYVLSFCKPESTEVKFIKRLYRNTVANFATAALMRFNLIVGIEPKILVHRVVQRVVQDRVLSKPELIEIVYRAGIISMYPFSDLEKYSVSDFFLIILHLAEKNERIGQTGCTIQKIFDHDWNLVKKNETATFIVLGVAFFQFHSESTLQEMFGAEKSKIGRDLLKQTCFRHISDAYFFPKEINQIMWESTVRSKTLSSLLWDRLDVDKLGNRPFLLFETSQDFLKSNIISVQENCLLLSLLCECVGLGSAKFTTFNKLYMELLKSKCIVVPNEVDELWLETNYQNRSESHLLVSWYICERMNWPQFICDAIWSRLNEYCRTMEPNLHVLLLHLCVQLCDPDRLAFVCLNLRSQNVTVESLKFPSLQFLPPAARSKYIDEFNRWYKSLKSQLRMDYQIQCVEKVASFLTK